MKSTEIVASFTRCLVNQTRAFEYSDGWLIDLPYSYLDGDSVRLFIEPINSGFRITDRGDAILGLEDIGMSTETGKTAEHIEWAVKASDLDLLGAEDYELSTTADESTLGCTIEQIARIALLIDSFRLEAKPQVEVKFFEKIGSQLRTLFGDKAQVRLRASLPQVGKGRRPRQVTASITRDNRTAYVQAIGMQKNPDGPVSRTHRTFKGAEAAKNLRFSALEGTPGMWEVDDLDYLSEVSTVTFDGRNREELYNQVDMALGASYV